MTFYCNSKEQRPLQVTATLKKMLIVYIFWTKEKYLKRINVSNPGHLYLSFIGKSTGTHNCWRMPSKIWEKKLNENKSGDAICSPGNTIVKNSKWSSTFKNKSKLLTALNTVGNAVPLWAQLLHERGRQCFVFQLP